MSGRVREELALLRTCWPGLEFIEAGLWVRLPEYRVAAPGWTPRIIEAALQMPAQLPGQAPYGFYVRPGLAFGGAPITNYVFPTAEPPFAGGQWGKFSWSPSAWAPASRIERGSNMVEFTRSITQRLEEGA